MSCNQGQTTDCCDNNRSGSGFVFIVVLYILLAIILSTFAAC